MTSRTLHRLHTRYRQREAVGVLKYNCTVDRRDLHPSEWLNHLHEELMDASLYAERMREGMALLEEARTLMSDDEPLMAADWVRYLRALKAWRERYDQAFAPSTRT